MKEQLFLFTGENSFALSEELYRWKSSFLAKHGEANFQILDGKTCTWMELLAEIHAAPFLSEKRLVLVEGMPTKIEKEEFETLPTGLHPATILTFVEGEPDKRKSVTKFLLKEATVKTFSPLTLKQLVPWILSLAREHGATMDERTAAHLVSVVGTDQWHLKNECLKLLSYVAENPKLEDIDRVCLPSEKHTVWRMSDLIGKGDALGALQFVRTLNEQGEDAFALWNIYLWIMKNLATLWIFSHEKNLSLPSLVKESGVPFPSAQALLPLTKKFSKQEMHSIVKQVTESDEALKTGGIKATTGEQGELLALLERQILMMR